MNLRFLAPLLLAGATSAWAGKPQNPPRQPADLTAMSLEELANIEVTSVAKKEQKLSQAAAAVYVITQEDIRRSGATSIPEALRMAPGLDVARIDANKWAVSSRGFNGQYSNKMLVLIDGRSVYSPLFSGVYWNVQDLLLEDIERIEIIRGPGATMWGANAVNGVINIISRHARETQGGLATAGAGSEEQGFGGLRYGGKLGSKAYYRIYTKYFKRNHLRTPSDLAAADEWHSERGGFRMDWEPSDKDSLTVQGDLYGGRNGQTLTSFSLEPPYTQTLDDRLETSGDDVLARWKRRFSGSSDMALQLYYDRYQRGDAVFGETRDTIDLDFQHRFVPSSRQEILWGLGHRFTTDRIEGTAIASIQPDRRGANLYSAFLQDEVELVRDRLRLAVGSKLEHNDYTGLEVQPSARILWEPRPRHAAWASIARAVRTPSRGEQDGRVNFAAFPGPEGLPLLLFVSGNRRLRSEDLLAYELGYRLQPSPRFSLDLATFYNDYSNLVTIDVGAPFFEPAPAPPHVAVPARLDNTQKGHTYGLEIAARFNPAERWRLSAGYTRYTGLPVSSGDASANITGGDSPPHQAQLRSYLNLTRNAQLDTAFYYVHSLRELQIPSYTRLDTRLGWRLTQDLDVSLVLQNLLDSRHPEFVSEVFVRRTEIGRSIYGRITWRF